MLFSFKPFRPHLPFIIIYISFLIIGISICNDYGISFDEPDCRSEIGILNYKYLTTGDYNSLYFNSANFHGAIFEIPLILIEKVFDLKDTKDIYAMRHLVTFLFFAISVIFFYLICFRFLGSKLFAIIGCVFLILSPKIFADAFYNSKDIPFLSMTIICIYTTLCFLSSRSVKSVFMHALASAILIDIRILGVIIPIFSIVYSLIKLLLNQRPKEATWRNILFVSFLIPLIILFWPVLWRNSLDNFIAAFMQMSKYNWEGYVKFQGSTINVNNLPWQYIPVWVGITTPLLYLLLFIAGIAIFIGEIISAFKKKISDCFSHDFEWLNFYVIFVPVISIILFKSILYDGWRHMYFIYPSIILFAVSGLKAIVDYFDNVKFKYFIAIVVTSSCIVTTNSMIQLHPYENLYFNYLTSNSLNRSKQKFDFDYWGISHLHGVKFLAEYDKSDTIKIYATDFPARANTMLLDSSDRKRFYFTGEDSADYFITAYRGHPESFSYPEIFSEMRGDAKIVTVGVLNTEHDFNLLHDSIFLHRTNNFEKDDNDWTGTELFDSIALSGTRSTITRNYSETSATYNCFVDSAWKNAGNLRALATINIYSTESFKYIFFVQVESNVGRTYIWRNINGNYITPNKWEKLSTYVNLSDLNKGDHIRIFLYNTEKKVFQMDDFELIIYKGSRYIMH